MIPGTPSPQYEARLHAILAAEDWEALREFARAENQIPDDVYGQDRHFWEVLLHKLIVNRIDMLGAHERSRAWLDTNGYTGDIGDF
ncbi:MAG: hypothetical protein JOY69_06555 [Candidatus Eremiobacteraeota bacterium]|nr:hypothetical protein [Candidatus Eremiobacteraeota bacterium]MBV8372903.1 hypothetical protein [Candidatus Eremiobacteraeota bacterium]